MAAPKYLATANRLLAHLPAEPVGFLLEHCEVVDLARHDILTQSGERLAHAYFPIDCFVSAIFKLEESSTVHIDLIGNEGMIDTQMVLGIGVASLTSVVQGAGRAFRIRDVDLLKLIGDESPIGIALRRYVAFRMDQLAQNQACTISHTVEQRLARWLLMARDRAYSSELLLTHEVLALMMGVRRERVSSAAGSLQKHGLISYSRGDITLLDEPALQAVSCSCYQSQVLAYDEVMGHQLGSNRFKSPAEN